MRRRRIVLVEGERRSPRQREHFVDPMDPTGTVENWNNLPDENLDMLILRVERNDFDTRSEERRKLDAIADLLSREDRNIAADRTAIQEILSAQPETDTEDQGQKAIDLCRAMCSIWGNGADQDIIIGEMAALTKHTLGQPPAERISPALYTVMADALRPFVDQYKSHDPCGTCLVCRGRSALEQYESIMLHREPSREEELVHDIEAHLNSRHLTHMRRLELIGLEINDYRKAVKR